MAAARASVRPFHWFLTFEKRKTAIIDAHREHASK